MEPGFDHPLPPRTARKVISDLCPPAGSWRRRTPRSGWPVPRSAPSRRPAN